jgi:hypothetical protein
MLYNKKSRKAQITVFMILGIILLFSTALIFYIKGKVQVAQEEVLPSLEEIPEFSKPVRLFVESCAKQKLEEGIKTAMEHGGIIYTDGIRIDTINPTEGEGVEYFPDSGYKVPYWIYMESANDCSSGCKIASKMPPLCKTGRINCISAGDSSVEEELQKYLDSEMEKCIGNFEQLRKQGYEIKETGNLSATVNIRDNDALALINYGLEVKKGDAEADIKDYYSAVQTNIAKLYGIALQLANSTANNCFYEQYTQEQIGTYSGLDEELPPTNEDTFFEDKRTWQKSEVEKRLNEIMINMISLVRYNNTQNFYIPLQQYQGEYSLTKSTVLWRTINYDIGNEQNAEVYTRFLPWWNSYLKIDPMEGQTIGPSNELKFSSGSDKNLNIFEQISKLLKHKEYALNYQYSYPVLTEIIALKYENDPASKEIFRFAQEVNLRFGTCMKPSTKIFSSGARQQTLLCDQDMRDEANTTITVFDDFNRSKAIEDVQVYFYAGERCDIGSTNNEGILITRMPKAFGYFLSFEKDGYMKTYIHEKDIQKPIKVYLKPIIQKNIAIRTINQSVLDMVKTAATTREAFRWIENSSEDIQDFDKFIISVERVKENYMDSDLATSSYYEDNEFSPGTIDLTTGKFTVDIRMTDNRTLIIPRELDRVCEESGLGGDCVKTPIDPDCGPRGKSEQDFKNGNCYVEGYTCESVKDAIAKGSDAVGSKYWQCGSLVTALECTRKSCKDEEGIDEDIVYNETNVTGIISGGVLLDNTTRYFEISDPDTLMQAENITFYVFRQETPTRHHQLQDLMKHVEWSKEFARYVMPKLE